MLCLFLLPTLTNRETEEAKALSPGYTGDLTCAL